MKSFINWAYKRKGFTGILVLISLLIVLWLTILAALYLTFHYTGVILPTAFGAVVMFWVGLYLEYKKEKNE